MIKFSFGGIVVFLFSLCLPLFTYTYACKLWELFSIIDLTVQREGFFVYAFIFALLFTLFFVSSNNFFSILNHELTHNLWAVLSFSRPTSLQVKAGKGGNFAFSGRKNIFTVLSPYFFPLTTLFLFPLYFVLSPRYLPYYFLVLGLSFGYSVATEVKQAHYAQPDLQVYGLIPSYLFIFFFQIFILGMLLFFVGDGWNGVLEFITEPSKQGYKIFIHFFNDIV